ncbi:MAG: threonine aldolase family protein [Chitinophagaceae bacterium]
MSSVNRRNFLKTTGALSLPLLGTASPLWAEATFKAPKPSPDPAIWFIGDGKMFEPGDYIRELQEMHSAKPIERDRYGTGGVVEQLEKKFAEITGKEKAVFLPSGTMANQLAIAVLCGEHTKAIVQETSHVFRDEADAAQSVFGKRLVPLAPEKTGFTAEELKQAVENLPNQEVFTGPVGAVSIENPVRRTNGRVVPIGEIKAISAYCRSMGIGLHLDGARLYMASAWQGIPVKEYAGYFDTVYISLYKYLGASAGAILCGDSRVIGKIPHLIKIHGGSMFGNWTNAAMALRRLEGLETRLQDARKRGDEIFAALNKLPGVNISPLDQGTNIYQAAFGNSVNGAAMQKKLREEYNIRIGFPPGGQKTQLTVNETLLYQDADYVINAFRMAIKG